MRLLQKLAVGLLLSLLLQTNAFAQNPKTNIRATLTDSSETPIAGASVVLLRAADSVLVTFTMSNGEGQIVLRKVPQGKYLLQISALQYSRYSELLWVEDGLAERELGMIKLYDPEFTLSETVIEGERTPIFINGDTLEYNADAFKTQPNDNVEDLLRKLPGVEVQRDGTVKAQGEEVQRVLVDGKEFFGDDPQMATKNLPADAIDRVQVFDKASETAEFTGVDDGNEQKTINLKLKEDKKQGVFGKVIGGYGTDNRYEGKANVNRFNNRLQFSTLGMINNINEAGFSLNDYLNFMGGMQNLMTGGGEMRLTIEDDGSLPIDMGNSQGLINTAGGGLNFNYDITKQTELSVNYLYSNIKTRKDREVYRENFLGDQTYISETDQDQLSQYNQHSVNLSLRTQLDSMTKLTWRNTFGIRDAFNTSDRFSRLLSAEQILTNEGFSDGETMGDRGNLSSNLTLLRRFKKVGRAFTANASFGAQNDQSDLDLFTRNRFYQGAVVSFADSVNQAQGQTVKQLTYSGRVTYTEPLGKGRYLEGNFMHSNFGENSRRDVFDRFPTGETLNDQLSNHFQKDYIYNRGGLSMRINRKKSRFNLGLNYQQAKLIGEIFSQDTLITQDFRNWLPSMRYSYDFGTAKSIALRYNTSIREPSLEQLQPLVNNTDPLNIYLGNPDLQAEYTHNVSTQLVIFDQFSFTNLFLNFNLRYTQNKITQSRRIDSLFRQTIQPVNVGQDIILTSFLNFGTPIKPLKIKLNLDVQTTYNRGIVFVNAIENTTDRWIASSVLSFENRSKDRIDWRIGGELGYNQSQYSVNAELDQSFVNQRYFFDLDINLDKQKKWQLSSQLDYWVYPTSGPFAQAQNIALWEASIGHTFLENDRARIELVGFDLLNQNIGLNRTNELNYFQEERITTLSRYVMLRFTWNLSAFGSQGVQIELNDRR